MASSSSSSSFDPPFYSRSWKHHVFLSFRGEDTRNTFVGHLHNALENMGIQTYKDDKKLSVGEAINLSLIEAIEQSQIAIIVFSENFADSTWCLNELTHIMKCRKERGLIVVPIFYGMEPSNVRKQEMKYGEAFAKYESEKNTNLASWRDALVEASGNCGQDFRNASTDESELIKDIVNKISKMIRPLTPRVNDNLVGIEARMEDLISKLQIGLDRVLMIGIWGVGGGGKTTLATSVYNKISREFDGCCSIENIREESLKNGLAKLQEKIISAVLKQKEVHVGSTEEGKDMIRDRLSGKKVLIVLDDVDQRDQLEALVGSLDWFAKGSIIMITTRDEHLLKAHKVKVHNISLLDNDEATKLLRKCAGLDHKPMEDYEQLSKQVVSYASGLPLALTILGSFLSGRGIHEWKSTLARLKKIPKDNIVGKLRISYDGLEKYEQNLFLDIACFFRRVRKDRVMPMLDACGLFPDIGLEVLREKALITILDEVVDMHDLVQEMGHYIVRGEHPNKPEKHSRIWKQEDVLTICAMDETTDLEMIEAICFRYNNHFSVWDTPLQHLPPIVANTKNLRWIDWEGDLSSPVLTNFPQRTLCCLKLTKSLQVQLWVGDKFLPNLKIMELSDLVNLIMTPNFAGLPNLEIFKLRECRNLQEIHSSFGLLVKLVFLSIEKCGGIKIFPSINRLKNLKTLSFKGSTGLFKLSKIQHKMDNLPYDPHLDDSDDTQLMNPLNNLKTYLVRGYDRLFALIQQNLYKSSHMNQHTRLWFYHSDLTRLNLSLCGLRDEDIGFSEWELNHLQELDLSGNMFSRLDFGHWKLPRFKWLSVKCCFYLEELSNLPSSIAVVDATDCWSLKSFGDTSNCKWLWKVSSIGGYKLHPYHGQRLVISMLHGNAIKDHFISIALEHQIPRGFLGRFFKVAPFISCRPHLSDTFTLHLPDDWYNEFSGFLIRVLSNDIGSMRMDIIMKQEPDEEDSQFEIWQEYDEAPEPEYDGEGVRTYVGNVSFTSLRQITSLNSSYNIISFSLWRKWSSFAVELVPLENKDDVVQTTNVATKSSEFWRDAEDEYFNSFKIHQNSKSNIWIHWNAF